MTELMANEPHDLRRLCLAITEHAPLPMATLDGATHVLRYGNPAFCALMHKPLGELIGKRFEELLPEKDACIALIERVFRTGKPERYTEEEPSKPHPIFWSYTIWPLTSAEQLVGILIQVTETAESHGKTIAMNEALLLGSIRQHEMTEAAEKLNEKLRQEIVERKRAEDAAEGLAKKLAAADRSKDEFLAMLAHELRNPLMPIRGVAEILRLKQVDDPVIAKVQAILERQANHMTRLVDDLLDTSRIKQRKVTLHFQRLDLASSVLAALDGVRGSIQANQHTLTMSIDNDPPLYIDADTARIAQILSNIVINAIKYTPKKGSIHVSTARENGMAVVRVRDNGIGIEPDLLEAIFGLFTQAEVSLERSQGGLGLGLKLVKELVEMQGGTVEAKSAGKGKGSEFIVRFPESLDSSPRVPMVKDAVAGSSRRILLIDDNADILESMQVMLTLSGHKVETADDGVRGVAKALGGKFDVALVDIGLPGMNGYEVAEAIRKDPGSANMVLFALTGYGQEQDKRRAFDSGFNQHLTKPVDPLALQDLLNGLEKYSRN